MTRTPPKSALVLLRFFLSDSAFEAVAGDLDEALQSGRGRVWYWTQTIKSIAAHLIGLIPTVMETALASLRLVRRQPVYAATVCGTLALAVATGTASAVVVKRAFIDALPYPHADRLVTLLTMQDGTSGPVSAHVFDDLKKSNPPFDLLAPVRPVTLTVSTPESTEAISGVRVTPEYFDLVGVQPAVGARWRDVSTPAVLVSWRYFTTTMRGDPSAIGRSMTIDGVQHLVTGVMPADFHPPYWVASDIWLPLDLTSLARDPRGRRQLTILARRLDGVAHASLATYLENFAARQRTEYPVEHGRQSWVAKPLIEEFTASARPALVGIAAAAALLLVIVCANIGGLSAARTLAMQPQTAVRHALGASRRRIFGEQLLEGLGLALIGTLLGLAAAPVLVGVAARYQRDFLERAAPFSLDTSTLVIGLVCGVVIGALAALVPARLLGPARVDSVLRGARGTTGTRRLTLARQSLVIAQVALALVLVIGAGLLVRTVQYLSQQSVGFSTAGMTSVSVSMPGARFATAAQQIQLEDAVVQQLSLIPGVTKVAASLGMPAGASMGASLHIEGRSTSEGLSEVGYTSVAPGFFEVMGLPLKAGRDLNASDVLGTTGAIVINEAMAKQHWPAGDALGARIYLGPGRPQPGAWMQVVGIVGDVRQSIVSPDVRLTAYGSTRQYSWPRRFFTVYTPDRPATLDADIRNAVRTVDPAVSIAAMFHLPEVFASQQGRHRLALSVFALFAAVSLILCATGLYAVVAMTSEMRRREYAIRVALGAQREQVRWQVARHAALLAGAGIAAGLALSVIGVRGVASLIQGVAPLDVPTYLGSVAVLGALACAAAWLPARRAARVDPVEALKAN